MSAQVKIAVVAFGLVILSASITLSAMAFRECRDEGHSRVYCALLVAS